MCFFLVGLPVNILKARLPSSIRANGLPILITFTILGERYKLWGWSKGTASQILKIPYRLGKIDLNHAVDYVTYDTKYVNIRPTQYRQKNN